MTPFRKMLSVQDQAALTALSSVGLVRRAQSALTKSNAVHILTESADQASVEVESFTVLLDTAGPAKARCDCPATGTCRHVLMAVLCLRATRSEVEDAPTAVETAPTRSAHDQIAALSLTEIRHFAGTDFSKAVRIANLSRNVVPEAGDASCVLILPDAPGPVTFLADAGLRGALFKGSDTRRKRFVAAAALIVGKHSPELIEQEFSDLDPELLLQAEDAVCESLIHGLSGEPRLAQDQLFDVAVSARADSAPRLAAMLRASAAVAGRLASHDPQTHPSEFLTGLCECHALIRALRVAPADPRLTGQIRREYKEVAPCEVQILGVGKWHSPTGGRGLTITGWNGQRFLSTGPARAGGMDPAFSPEAAYRSVWWTAITPSRMTGQTFHLPSPRMSEDGVLAGQLEHTRSPLVIENLPFHDDWQKMMRDVGDRSGIGLRHPERATPALVKIHQVGKPNLNSLTQSIELDIVDRTGQTIALKMPNSNAAKAIYSAQTKIFGALIDVAFRDNAPEFRAISVFYDAQPEIWNLTLDAVPKSLVSFNRMEKLHRIARHLTQKTSAARRANRVSGFADQVIDFLAGGVAAASASIQRQVYAEQADALGLTAIAVALRCREVRSARSDLDLCWQLVLIRRAAQRMDYL